MFRLEFQPRPWRWTNSELGVQYGAKKYEHIHKFFSSDKAGEWLESDDFTNAYDVIVEDFVFDYE